jgi:tRNA pseudouridine38-40 synthase
MARYQIILAYDGTGFYGFQKQASSRTVQGVVEEALRRLNWQGTSLLAAGRTDTGVHASGQVIAFDLDWRHSEQDLLRALNANLPSDVAASCVQAAGEQFHPRFDARARWYRYHLFCQPDRDPLRERYAWRVWPAVELERMQQAAALLPGRHDFSAFGSPVREGGSTVRTVFQAGWQPLPGLLDLPLLVFEISADAFLYHMVRRLVAFQVGIGQGLVEPGKVRSHLDRQDLEPVQGLAPAQGLFLTRVEYSRPAAG